MVPTYKALIVSVAAAIFISAVTYTITLFQTLNQGYDVIYQFNDSHVLTETRVIPETRDIPKEEVLFQLYSIRNEKYDIYIDGTQYSQDTDIRSVNVLQISQGAPYTKEVHRNADGQITHISFTSS